MKARKTPPKQATPLNPQLYSTAQVLASQGGLPADHPLWHLDDSDEGDRRQKEIQDAQRRLVPHLTPGETNTLSALIQKVTGQPITDSMHGEAFQIRRAVFAWVDASRAEWVGGSLDHFRFLPPQTGALMSRPVASPRRQQPAGYGGCSCGTEWRGELICHCATCHLTFTSVGPFDEHRYHGRCRTEAELTERGLAPNDAGHWRRPMPADRNPWTKERTDG